MLVGFFLGVVVTILLIAVVFVLVAILTPPEEPYRLDERLAYQARKIQSLEKQLLEAQK